MRISHRTLANSSLLALLALLCGAISGCSEKTEMTRQEEQSFKGNGKMPPEAAAAIARQRQSAQSRAGGPGGPPPESVPGTPKAP